MALAGRTGYWAASGIIGLALVGIVAYGVLLRYVFRMPTAYALELPEVLFIAGIALCLAYTQMKGGHVRIEVLTSRMPNKLQGVVGIFAFLVMLAYCVIVAWALWQRTAENLNKGVGSVETHLPLAPFSFMIVVGISLLALQVIIEIARLLSSKDK